MYVRKCVRLYIVPAKNEQKERFISDIEEEREAFDADYSLVLSLEVDLEKIENIKHDKWTESE